MAGNKKPAVVAELGRPETPAETAARKAQDSRNYRQRKTVNNLVFSLLVSLAAVLFIVLMVPRGVGDVEERTVDVAELAAASSAAVEHDLIVPKVPQSWLPRQAELRVDGSVTYWYIGYTTTEMGSDHEAYAAVIQAFTTDGSAVDDEWIATQLEEQDATGTETIDGQQWTVYDHPERNPDGANMVFGLEQRGENTALLVYGTDTPDVLRNLASSAQHAMRDGS